MASIIHNLSASFTRPADTTAYAATDLIANDVDAGDVVPLLFSRPKENVGAEGIIRRARIFKSKTTGTLSARLHLYAAKPVPANGDNGTWSTNKAADYLGAIDVTVDRAFTDGMAGQGVPNVGSEISLNQGVGAGGVLYGLLEALGAYTPASGETITVTLEVLQE